MAALAGALALVAAVTPVATAEDVVTGSAAGAAAPDGTWEPPVSSPSPTHVILEDGLTGEVEVWTPGYGIVDVELIRPHELRLRSFGDQRVDVTFRTPGDRPVAVGYHEVGGRNSESDGSLGFVVGSSGCGEGGWYAVDEIEVDAEGLVMVAARAGSRCSAERMDGANRRPWSVAFRWERGTDTGPDPVGPPPADYPRSAPSDRPGTDRYVYLDSHPDDYVGRGDTWVFTEEDRLTFDWRYAGSELRVWVNGSPAGTFAGPTSVPLRVGFHPGLNQAYNHGRGSISWGMEGRGCSFGRGGSFSLDHLVLAPSGEVDELVLRFLRSCMGAPPMYGEVVWDADIDAVLAAQPDPDPSDPTDPTDPTDPVAPRPPTFPDVTSGPHRPAIEALAAAGVIEGRADGRFAPTLAVTRGQVASFVVRALDLDVPTVGGAFPDAAGGPHAANVTALVEAGIVDGFPDGTFRPNQAVTRGQMATILARGFGVPAVSGGPPFPDAVGSPHADAIAAVAAAGIAEGRPDGTFGTGDPTRRDQMASFLARASGLD